MRRSENRILVSHAGTLPRPADLQELFDVGPGQRTAFQERLPSAVKEVVHHEAEIGIDVVNDGELSKLNFSHYARERLSGLEQPANTARQASPRNIVARDAVDYPEFHRLGGGRMRRAGTPVLPGANVNPTVVCTGPLKYVGADTTAQDIANFKAALAGLDVEGFLPAIAPGTIEHWLFNEYYASDEEFLFAIADAMHAEYRAITDAGLNLQIDDPDLPDGWQMYPDMSVEDYRKYAQVRVEALNHALRDLPMERIRFHTCWGSSHGPHKNDIALRHIIDLILSIRAECISIEASNPRHENDWRVWEEVRLPEGKSLMPGVVGHCTDLIEDPELVAFRLERYAGIVGRENVIAGTDCGLGQRVGHPEIVWAKLAASAEGARIASKRLWK